MAGAWPAAGLIGAIFALMAAGAGFARDVPPPVEPAPHSRILTGEAALATALKLLVDHGQWADVLKLLETLPPGRRAAVDLQLIEAQAWRRLGQPRRALDIYRKLLRVHRNAQLVRLELAQSFYEAKDLAAADYNFRLALAGPLPEADRRLMHAYLTRIAAERPWRVQASLAVAPDSNVNGATDTRQVQILGLPFDLSDEARRQPGVALSGAVALDGSIPVRPGAKLLATVYGQASETRERAFGTEAAGLRIGPELSRGEDRWSLQATGERRWYGGAPLYRALGAALQAQFSQGPTTAVVASASAQHLDYDKLTTRTGWLYGLDLQLTRYLSPQSFWRLGLGLRRERASDAGESYSLAVVSIGYYHALPLGLAGYVEPSVSVQRNDGADDIFGVARRDTGVSVSARLIKQDYSLWGFAPYLGATVSRNVSTVPLYTLSRQRAEVGVTRTF